MGKNETKRRQVDNAVGLYHILVRCFNFALHYKELKTSTRSYWQVRVQLPHNRVRQRNLSFHRRLLKKISLCTHTLSGHEIGTSLRSEIPNHTCKTMVFSNLMPKGMYPLSHFSFHYHGKMQVMCCLYVCDTYKSVSLIKSTKVLVYVGGK